jgi:hypothetical protein
VTWARWTSGLLLIILVGTYVLAKVHFFTRFFALPLDTYWAEHWPFTAGLTCIAALLWLLASRADAHDRRQNERREE